MLESLGVRLYLYTENKHNVKAMVKNANRPPSDEVALSTALEAARPFHEFPGDAIKGLETLGTL